MIIEYLLSWVETASDFDRVEAAVGLVSTFKDPQTDRETREEIEAALTYFLDDTCLDVRVAIADASMLMLMHHVRSCLLWQTIIQVCCNCSIAIACFSRCGIVRAYYGRPESAPGGNFLPSLDVGKTFNRNL